MKRKLLFSFFVNKMPGLSCNCFYFKTSLHSFFIALGSIQDVAYNWMHLKSQAIACTGNGDEKYHLKRNRDADRHLNFAIRSSV